MSIPRPTPYPFLAVLTLFVLFALYVDARGGLLKQVAIGVVTAIFVTIALLRAPPNHRLQIVTMIVVATCFECAGSLLLRLYEYKLGNLPLYVPPGHGLFYLAALRVASLPALRQRSSAIVTGVLALSGVWALRGLLLSLTPDVLGLLCWVLLAAFLLRGRDPLFFAVSFVATMALEYYGTFLGTWRWAARVPVLGIPGANPPSAIGAGYCIIDATVQFCLPHLARALGRWRAFGPQRELHIESAGARH